MTLDKLVMFGAELVMFGAVFVFKMELIIIPHSCLLLLLTVASVMFDAVRPHGLKPTRLPRPWDSPGKNTGVGCHFLKVKVKSLSRVQLLATPWTAAYQAPPSTP